MVNGKSKPIRKGGFHSKKEAIAAADDIEAELRKGIVPHLDPVPFDEYFESWVKVFRSDVSKNTRARYEDSIRNVKKYFGGKPIQQITKTAYQSFLNDYAKDGDKAKATLKKINTHIRACARDAIDEGIIRIDFTRDAKFPGKDGKPKEEKHLDYDESLKLLDALMDNSNKTHTQYMILLGLTSGMRFGEIVGLTRKDFDFVNNTININKTWGHTKRMHEGFGPTKNLHSERKIKMNKEIMSVFNELFDTMPDNIHRLVFFSAQSKYKVISNVSANKALKILCNKLDIKNKSMHGLRHTKASVMLYRGISI